jgi:oligo-1,6-glucosidase
MWWKEAVVYQVYPRSFYDSNADGIGDLKGITAKLDYLKDLGIDVIWLSPHFKSPNADNGYDISDYEGIMEEFGTMADFDELLAAIHQKGLKLIIDLVVNHSSDEHNWFQESRKSKDNPFRDFYIWKKEIPNDWISFFSGSAWAFDEITKEYYLHYFVKKQPDLNWENPQMRQAIYKMMHFWLQKGVNGFRMDVISLISKDQTFPNFPNDRKGDLSFYANGPKVHQYLQEMNQEVLSKYDCMTVGEAFGVNAEQANLYVGNDRNELQMIYHFEHAVPRNEACFVDPIAEFSLIELKKIFDKWDKATQSKGWNTIYFGNHDNPRMLSRFGDTGKYRNESAKMLATILLTLRGTPYIYQGDEIGMSNAIFNEIGEYNDVQVINAFEALVVKGVHKIEDFYAASNKIARDHARTPMQWSSAKNAGFSKATKPWLKVNENYPQVNVYQQVEDKNSVLNYYKKLIHIRKNNSCFVYGIYTDLRPNCDKIWLYLRENEEEKILVMNNFTNETQTFQLDFVLKNSCLVLDNYYDIVDDLEVQNVKLRPYEARIYSFN